jgi:hypothetical protein
MGAECSRGAGSGSDYETVIRFRSTSGFPCRRTGNRAIIDASQTLLMVRLPASIAAAVLLLLAAPVMYGASAPSPATSIRGNAWTADNQPVPAARLRLRNLMTGKVEAATQANQAGEFTFANVEGGSYLVELVNDTGHVLAVGHRFSIAPGETVGTFVRLGTRVPWFSGFFGNAAAAVASIAASQGITALAPIVRPATSGR